MPTVSGERAIITQPKLILHGQIAFRVVEIARVSSRWLSQLAGSESSGCAHG